ncbi:MAG: toxin [Proteobacteria bacterium]|nr:toxin [Pseudomonadota bacterium]
MHDEARHDPRGAGPWDIRIALALNRAIEEMKAHEKRYEKKRLLSQQDALEECLTLMTRSHAALFQDWKEQGEGVPGTMRDTITRETFRSAAMELVGLTEKGSTDGLFDSNGYVVRYDVPDAAKRLAKFYKKVRDAKPFEYGSQLTLDFFVVALSKLPTFRAVYAEEIDFRRLDRKDIVALHHSDDVNAIATAFQRALGEKPLKAMPNVRNGYGEWERHEVYIAGNPFLAHEMPDGMSCLVTVNGGLVPRHSVETKLKEHLKKGELLADFPPIPDDMLVGYLPNTEHLRSANKHDIDGIPVQAGAAPILGLGQNILTGLGADPHNKLRALLDKVADKDTPLFRLASNRELYDKMIRAAGDDARMRRIVEVAYTQLTAVTKKLDHEKLAIMNGKHPVDHPKLFVSMGGAGAGKSVVEEMARAECGDNLIIASLDEFRNHSDLYKVLMAANHHGDDYRLVEPFANSLRTWVADTARENKINTLYDGTGIEYQPRYAKVVEDFKKFGFETNVVAVDTALTTPEKREADYPVPARKRVTERQAKIGRALPWDVVNGKHIKEPDSVMQAVSHRALDKFSLFANDAGSGQHYLVAETFNLKSDELDHLKQSQKNFRLKPALEKMTLNHEQSAIARLESGKGDPNARRARLSRNPRFREDNVSVFVPPMEGGGRALVSYDNFRFVDMLEKGRLNPDASCPEALDHISGAQQYLVGKRHHEEPHRLRFQPSLGEVSTPRRG